jgi:segregation and condensation protein B
MGDVQQTGDVKQTGDAQQTGDARQIDDASRAADGPEIGDDPDAGDPESSPAADAIGEDLLLRSVTALVFASPDPLTDRKLASLCGGERSAPSLTAVRAALDTLGRRLLASGLPLELRSIAGGWRILTTPETGETIKRLFETRKIERISPAALETLAIVAYRQPVTKAEIEAIRGVQAGPILRSLVDRDLIRVSSRADVPGHPLQYSTTKGFLDRFGLAGLGDLPRDSELTR